jgi:hypothetical protein
MARYEQKFKVRGAGGRGAVTNVAPSTVLDPWQIHGRRLVLPPPMRKRTFVRPGDEVSLQ